MAGSACVAGGGTCMAEKKGACVAGQNDRRL